MRIVIAPDSYKGSLSAFEVANSIARGMLKVFPLAEVLKVPIADGGEGTVEALVTATGGKMIVTEVSGPLNERVEACWGILGDGETAVIEMATASGLTLISKEKRNPLITTTYGTGELIKEALDRGLRKLIIGIGGSATNDGGAGVAQALGVKLLDGQGNELPHGGAALINLAEIDIAGLDKRLQESTIMVACDLDNPLGGERGASAVFGPQKGATPEMVAELDAALQNYQKIACKATGRNIAELPGAGAAGGLGAGLMFFTSAKLRPGVDIVIEATGLSDLVATADLVITGEGCTDFQTAFGKAPVGVAKLANQFGVPVVCLSGSLGQGHHDVLDCGIDALMNIIPCPICLEECMAGVDVFTEEAATRLGMLLKVGMRIEE